MSLTLLSNASRTIDDVLYALIGGVIAGFIIDYTTLPAYVMLILGLVLMYYDLGVGGVVADILEGVGFALVSLGAYDILKNKITITAS